MLPPGAMQNSKQWFVCLQFAQIGLVLFATVASAVLLEPLDVRERPSFSRCRSSCSSLRMRFLMSAELMEGLDSSNSFIVDCDCGNCSSVLIMRIIFSLS